MFFHLLIFSKKDLMVLSRGPLECSNQNVRGQANLILLNMPEVFEPENDKEK